MDLGSFSRNEISGVCVSCLLTDPREPGKGGFPGLILVLKTEEAPEFLGGL